MIANATHLQKGLVKVAVHDGAASRFRQKTETPRGALGQGDANAERCSTVLHMAELPPSIQPASSPLGYA